MKKLWPLFILLVFSGDCPSIRAESEGRSLPPLPGMTSTFRAPARNEAIVFVDGVGKHFHRASCRLLGENRYSMGKKTAVYNGFSPCRECWRD